MANPLIIDAHMHLYATKAEGQKGKATYEIWEYGPKSDVQFSRYDGDVEDGIRALDEAGASKGIVVSLFSVDRTRQIAVMDLPDDIGAADKEREIEAIDASMGDRLKELNDWTCEMAKPHDQLVPFIAADPWALSSDDMCAEISDKVRNHGAKGIKLHGVLQQFHMSDQRMWPIYQTCVDEGIAIVAHSGPARGADQFADPRAFAGVLEAFPNLKLIMAHMGGGAWQQAREIAEAFPNAIFDCSEVIAWHGGSNAPSDEQLGQLIKDVGPHRVIMGSDFPWYGIDYTANRVMELPVLSTEEKEAILGANAQRILDL